PFRWTLRFRKMDTRPTMSARTTSYFGCCMRKPMFPELIIPTTSKSPCSPRLPLAPPQPVLPWDRKSLEISPGPRIPEQMRNEPHLHFGPLLLTCLRQHTRG